MLKVATSSATPANTSRNASKNPRNWSLMSSLFSSVRASPVIASIPSGRTWSKFSTSWSWLTPDSAATSISDALPGLANSSCAWSNVNAAKVTAPRLSSPPIVRTPTTSTCVGLGVSTVIVSPIAMSWSSATCLSIATSPSDSGARPSATSHGLRPGSGVQLAAIVGGPLPPIGLPFLPTIWPNPLTAGSATRTPSTSRTVSTSDSSIRPRCVPWSSVLTSDALRTTASVPALTSVNKSSKPARMVSPSTNVPTRKATPSTTANTVPNKRRLCAHSPLRLTLSMCGPSGPTSWSSPFASPARPVVGPLEPTRSRRPPRCRAWPRAGRVANLREHRRSRRAPAPSRPGRPAPCTARARSAHPR